MDSRERVIRTLEFKKPDRIPVDLWTLPVTHLKYEKKLDEVIGQYEKDIVTFVGPLDLSYDGKIFRKGSFMDAWGSGWMNLQEGMAGEVREPVLKDIEKLDSYGSPVEKFKFEWSGFKSGLEEKIMEQRQKGKFILGGWVSIFERMQFLRGTENLYCDLAEQSEEVFKIRNIVVEYYKEYLKSWLQTDIDGVVFGDDWGSQRALLISPDLWKSFFRPVYKELFDMILAKGKYIFMHSDGYIMDIYPELISLGLKAINSQLWCMGVEKVAEKFAGKITFWGEISRQNILPNGTPEDIKAAAEKMKKYLFVNGGGLIGQSEVGEDVPLENIKALLDSWN